MVYALWDMETINLAADYDILRDALALVLEGIERNGPHDTGARCRGRRGQRHADRARASARRIREARAPAIIHRRIACIVHNPIGWLSERQYAIAASLLPRTQRNIPGNGVPGDVPRL